jgi:hypothetical protein
MNCLRLRAYWGHPNATARLPHRCDPGTSKLFLHIRLDQAFLFTQSVNANRHLWSIIPDLLTLIILLDKFFAGNLEQRYSKRTDVALGMADFADTQFNWIDVHAAFSVVFGGKTGPVGAVFRVSLVGDNVVLGIGSHDEVSEEV